GIHTIGAREGRRIDMSIVCGADGCKAGWLAVSKDIEADSVSWRLCRTARDLFYDKPIPEIIALDVPIGLPESHARTCDTEARRLLGRRASSVFPAPIRPVLAATDYAQACQIRFEIEGKKLSRQSFAILPKICEVDA